jgi:hypothetical protein
MRQYLRVAVIEVSEESLRLIAGDEVLGQAAGLVDGGMVADVRLDGLLVSAIVAGTSVSVRVLEDALAWKCPCPGDAPCVHVVAAALADRLVSARLNTGWDVFTDGPAKYADVLGPAGLARCAELLGQHRGKKSHGLAGLRESLARAQAALTAAES